MPAVAPRILADMRSRLRRRTPLLAIGAGIGLSLAVVSAIATVPDSRIGNVEVRHVLDSVSPAAAEVIDFDESTFVHMERIHSGDSLGSILGRFGSSDEDTLRFIASSRSGQMAMRGLRAGRTVKAQLTGDGLLQMLEIPLSERESYYLYRDEAGLRDEISANASSSVIAMRSGTIRSTLFGATDAAGLPDDVAIKLAELFGTEIDFHTDLRVGDRFSVVFESITERGVEVATGRILAAEFINRGKRHAVVHYTQSDGSDGYFTPEGQNLKQAFLRSPLEFSRVTSGFAMRLHPILNSWRQHKGVDFGARIGTSVKATSDGQIEFVGTKSGYGNTVVLRHRNGISTLYAHLNGFPRGLAEGQRVSQGDLIGYVGQTGWATGPHLHYEFRKNGDPINPMGRDLPTAEPLSTAELKRFRDLSGSLLNQLALLNRSVEVASID